MRVLLLGVLLAAGPLAADVPTLDGRTAELEVSPLALEGGSYADGVDLVGAWRLDSPDEAFGGLSGLLVEGSSVTAVTDQGTWVTGVRAGETLAPAIALRPMIGERGETFDKTSGDAEGLARRGGRLIVSFERDHRIAAHVGGGQLGRTVRNRRFASFENNAGLEALATLPDGRLIAVTEGFDARGFTVVVVNQRGRVAIGRLPKPSRHQVTGADVGPDGRFYLLLRDYSIVRGVSIRLLRYRLGPNGLPDPESATPLAAWESASGIDNMEGVSVFRDGDDGPVTVWLISDDNFNPLQRTILVALKVGPR